MTRKEIKSVGVFIKVTPMEKVLLEQLASQMDRSQGRVIAKALKLLSAARGDLS